MHADERKRCDAYLRAIHAKLGEQWHVRQIWDDVDGWQIEWHCGEYSLKLRPVAARQLARELHEKYSAAIAKMDQAALQAERTTPAQFLAWFDIFDAKAKEAIHLNRAGTTPDGITGTVQ